MELTELEHHELVALVLLSRIMIDADGVVTDEETDLMWSTIATIGSQRWFAAQRDAEALGGDAEAIEAAIVRVERMEARVAIRTHLADAAESDGVEDQEIQFIEWLDEVWFEDVDESEPEA